MSEIAKAYVVGAGVVSPIGANAHMTSAALAAGIGAIEDSAFLNSRLKAIKMANISEELLQPLAEKLKVQNLPSRQVRILQIAHAALIQLKNEIPANVAIPLVLALPEILPGIGRPWQGDALAQLAAQTGFVFDMTLSRAAEIGRAGGAHALKHVFKLMDAGQDLVLLGGVDSYWDPELISRLDADGRLLVEGGLDGFQPGEGAGFLLLTSERFKHQLPQPRVSLGKPGVSQESGHRYSDLPYRGEGLTLAVRDAIANSPGIIEGIWTSMIYDSFGNKEFGVALSRNSAAISPKVSLNHPVDCFGDLGAAIGPTLISVVRDLALRKKNIGKKHLVCCSSDTSYRSAVLLDIES